MTFLIPTKTPIFAPFPGNRDREVAQAGSAPGLGPGGRRFESCLPDKQEALHTVRGFFIDAGRAWWKSNSRKTLFPQGPSEYPVPIRKRGFGLEVLIHQSQISEVLDRGFYIAGE